MEHKQSIRICENASSAVLFIHGIVGTPNHFREFVPLVPEHMSLYNLLLDGHGKSVRDFSKTSMEKWETQVTSVVEELSATHQKIYIVAHSLGTLLAIEQAVKNEKICKMFLMAVPLHVRLKPKVMTNSMKVYFDKIRPDDYEAQATKNCYGIAQDRNPLHYLGWIPRFLELLAKIRQTRNTLERLDTPCVVYQSDRDEMVSRRSEKYLSKPNIAVKHLVKSGHYCYDRDDFALLKSELQKMLSEDS